MPDRLELSSYIPGDLPPHPRLLFTDHFRRARWNLGRKPYRDWYFLLRQQADLPVYGHYSRVRNLARQAKACAALYQWEANPAYRQKVQDLLRQLPEPPEIIDLEGGRANEGWGDFLQSAEAIPDLCVAYDLMLAELPGELTAAVKRKTLGVVQQLIDAFKYTPRNNHVVVMAVAVVTAALTFDEPQEFITYSTPELYSLGMTHLSESLGLIAPDGGYGEGPYYARYILSYLAPFSLHLNHAAGVRLFDHPYLQRLVTWVMDNDKGNGGYTQFDDSFTTQFFFLPLISAMTPSGHMWDAYFRNLPKFNHYQSNMVEGLLIYQPSRSPGFYEPFFKAKFYPDMGQVIFHDRQPSPEFFAIFLFEQERYFADVHEQIDPFSMELSAFGEDFIIDGGYGAGTPDKNRPYFLSQKANSTILVDGVGTNPNPLSGDELQAELEYAFTTPGFASAGLIHHIGDVALNRQVFYGGAQNLIIFDCMEGQKEHTYTLQLNYLGDFADGGAGRLQWSKNQVQLNARLLSDEVSDWYIRQDRGLYTVGSRTFEMNVAQIQSVHRREVELAFLWSASKAGIPFPINEFPLSKGEGRWYRIENRTEGKFEDVVWNQGGRIATPQWESDARLLWIRYTSALNPEGILMVQGSTFRQGPLQIESTHPLTLYLERQNSGWVGYVHFDTRLQDGFLILEGLGNPPVKINGRLIEYSFEDGRFIIPLREPGTLNIGIGRLLIQTPKRYLPEADFLYWISRKPAIRKNATFWSDYERNQFENQITRNLLMSTDQVFNQWGEKLTGDSLIFHDGLNVTQGLLQYGYRSTSDGKGIRLPHRYQVAGGSEDSRWRIREEGDWRQTGPQVRDLWFQGKAGQQLGVSYRFLHPFGSYWGHRLEADWNREMGIRGSFIRTTDSRIQDYHLYWMKDRWQFRPGVLLKDQQISRVLLEGGYEPFQGNFSVNQLQSDPIYREWIHTRLGRNLRLLGEGVQSTADRRQTYRAHVGGLVQQAHAFSAGMGITYQEDWAVNEGSFRLSGPVGALHYFQQIEYWDEDYFFNGGVSGKYSRGFWSANLRLKNWRLGKQGGMDLVWFHQFPREITWNARGRYAYLFDHEEYRFSLDQEALIPFHENWMITPLWNFQLGRQWNHTAVGWGVLGLFRYPFSFRLIQYRAYRPYLYYSDGEINFPISGEQGVGMQAVLMWSEDRLQYAEVRIRQNSPGTVTPGIFYRYLRPREQRMEGFLEWRW
ncbi:MAG: hypothetical protein Kow0042_09090 [Calditrichia bacterium]